MGGICSQVGSFIFEEKFMVRGLLSGEQSYSGAIVLEAIFVGAIILAGNCSGDNYPEDNHLTLFSVRISNSR